MTKLIQLEPGNGVPATVTVIFEGDASRIRNDEWCTILDGTPFPDVEIGFLWTAEGGFVPPPGWISPAERRAREQAGQAAASKDMLAAAIDLYVEDIAKRKDYKSAAYLASYATSTNANWRSEAETFIAWRDQVWAKAYLIMSDVLSGSRPIPTVEAMLAELPNAPW